MTDTPRETRVLNAVVALVDSLLEDFDVVDLLTTLTQHCVELLDVAAVGILLGNPLQQLRLLAAHLGAGRELEVFQLQADEGPCLDCYATGQTISVADLQRQPHDGRGSCPSRSRPALPRARPCRWRAAGIVFGRAGLVQAPAPASSARLIFLSARPFHTSHVSHLCRNIHPHPPQLCRRYAPR